MEPIGHHIRSRLADNRVIAQSDEQRRLLARVVLAQGRRDGLLAFSVPDTHMHQEALCSARAASRLSQRIGSSLSQRLKLGVPFVTYPYRPILDQQHLSNTVRYHVIQHEHCVQDRCSNGILTNWESCDGDKFNGKTCESEGFVGGEIGCLGCDLDLSECDPVATCGNGTVDASEMCDGSDLTGATCWDFAFQTGDLGCTWNCRYDQSGCR